METPLTYAPTVWQDTIASIKEAHATALLKLAGMGMDTRPLVVKPSANSQKKAKQKEQQEEYKRKNPVAPADGPGDKVRRLMQMGVTPHNVNLVVGAETFNSGVVMEAPLRTMIDDLISKRDKHAEGQSALTALISECGRLLWGADLNSADEWKVDELRPLVKFLYSRSVKPEDKRPTRKADMAALVQRYGMDEWEEMLNEEPDIDSCEMPCTDEQLAYAEQLLEEAQGLTGRRAGAAPAAARAAASGAQSSGEHADGKGGSEAGAVEQVGEEEPSAESLREDRWVRAVGGCFPDGHRVVEPGVFDELLEPGAEGAYRMRNRFTLFYYHAERGWITGIIHDVAEKGERDSWRDRRRKANFIASWYCEDGEWDGEPTPLLLTPERMVTQPDDPTAHAFCLLVGNEHLVQQESIDDVFLPNFDYDLEYYDHFTVVGSGEVKWRPLRCPSYVADVTKLHSGRASELEAKLIVVKPTSIWHPALIIDAEYSEEHDPDDPTNPTLRNFNVLLLDELTDGNELTLPDDDEVSDMQLHGIWLDAKNYASDGVGEGPVWALLGSEAHHATARGDGAAEEDEDEGGGEEEDDGGGEGAEEGEEEEEEEEGEGEEGAAALEAARAMFYTLSAKQREQLRKLLE